MQQIPETDVKADCYSERERALMDWSQKARGHLLAPLLQAFARHGVSPNHLTLLSALVGLAFCPLYFWWPRVAYCMLGIHVLLDGLDGPLARHLGSASRKGTFTDTTADQIVVVLSTVTLMAAGRISVVPGGLYIFLYTVVVIFAMVRNALNVPYSWLLRPRLLVYGWIVVDGMLMLNSIDSVLWLFNTVLGLKMLSGFVRIRERI